MLEFISITWLKPLVKKLATIRGGRRAELNKIGNIFGDPEVLARYYIEPKCQERNPAERDEDRDPEYETQEPAFQYLNKVLGREAPLPGGTRHLFILSGAGMGKTSLLLMLKLGHLSGFWPKGYDCLLLKLGEDTLGIVEAHQDRAHTVLLLDALDEDPLAWGNIENRLLTILQATENFRRVIISCRTQFFPETGADPFKVPGRVEVGGYVCPMKFLSLFDEEQVGAYLRKRFAVRWCDPRSYGNGSIRRQAEDLVGSLQSLRFRPLLLAHIQDILDAKGREWNAYTLYEAMVESWLLREERKFRKREKEPPTKEMLWAVCSEIAQDMQARGARSLTGDELAALIRRLPAAAHLKDLDVGGRSLMNLNAEGHFRFSHYSIQEFLVAHALVTGHADLAGPELRFTDQILAFLDAADGLDFQVLERLLSETGLHHSLASLSYHDPLPDGSRGPAMRLIMPGEFLMGSAKGDPDERPEHRVRIEKLFALGVYPVTFAEYDRFAAATGRRPPDDSKWGRGTRPVINVLWHDASDYCKWLSEQTGQRYRLPTEAEWEYAIRADGDTAYWWGDDTDGADTHAWYRENSGKRTHPVGEKPANRWGLYDMAGNVREWTEDHWHDNYEGAPEDGSAWQEEGDAGDAPRVVRGGSWDSVPSWLRSSARFWNRPGFCYFFLGFRLARSL